MKKMLKRSISAVLSAVLAAGMMAAPVSAAEKNSTVGIDMWKALGDEASMGNVATDNNREALYNPDKTRFRWLQIR